MAEFDRQLKDHGSTIYGRSRNSFGPRIDYTLLFLLVALMATGVMILYSASGQQFTYVKRQLVFMAAGLVAMLVVGQIPTRFLERWLLCSMAVVWFYW